MASVVYLNLHMSARAGRSALRRSAPGQSHTLQAAKTFLPTLVLAEAGRLVGLELGTARRRRWRVPVDGGRARGQLRQDARRRVRSRRSTR